MNFSDFEEQIQTTQRQLSQWQANQSEAPSPAEAHEMILALSVSLEELHVAGEELETQNLELIATREELERERQQYQNLFELAPDGYVVTDLQGVIQNANRAAEILLGVRQDRLKNKPLIVFVEQSFHQIIHTTLDSLIEDEDRHSWEIKLQPRHSEPFYAAVSLAVERDDLGNIRQLLWSIRDISDRLEAEAKIRQQAQLIEVTTDAIIVVDLNNRVTYCNRSAERLYDWIREEVLERDVSELWGEEILPELTAAKKSLLERGKWQGELRKLTNSQNKLLVESRWTLVRDRQNQPQAIMIVDTDITEKKRIEEQLYHAQRLESIGTLASGIAHDLNNILNPILGSVQLLPATLDNSSKTSHELIKTIEKNAKRGADLVARVLTFSRAKAQQSTNLKISDILQEVAETIGEVFPKAIDIKTNIPDNLRLVNANSTQVHQAILNLCINARDAMPNGGSLTLSASNLLVDKNYARQHLEASEGKYVAITVADTGTGIPPQNLKRIFEPFFTTKDIGEGTGLGLFTLLKIVKNHNGFVDLVSEVGKGTKFQIFLPAIETVDLDISSIEQTATSTSGNRELILVVDDEPDNLEVAQMMLELAGYEVMTANSGDAAISTYQEHNSEIELILMDMMMPKMDGATAIDHLIKISPQLKIIGLSGVVSKYSLADHPHVSDFVAKPILREKLLTAIERVLQV